jgi:ABC-type branched-subunit amino acid transport system ATPase component
MLLEVRDLHAGYGALDVLRGVSIAVDRGEMVAVLGPNGAGKSTLLRAISHLEANVRSGTIVFDGHDLVRASTVAGVRWGCLHVPEGRQLFTELSVDDNLRLGAFSVDRGTIDADVAAIYARFPSLAERKAQTAFALSGGEQQMLAIGRALMAPGSHRRSSSRSSRSSPISNATAPRCSSSSRTRTSRCSTPIAPTCSKAARSRSAGRRRTSPPTRACARSI